MDLTAGENDVGTATLLSISGGFLDAFAYVGHGKVFANALTGNIALMGVALGQGNYTQALAHVSPICAFVLAILTYHLMNIASPMNSKQRSVVAVASICLEVGVITAAILGRRLFPEPWVIPAITFVSTLQTVALCQLNGMFYTSTMVTGNLRRACQLFLTAVHPHIDRPQLRQAFELTVVSAAFLVGAVIGAVSYLDVGSRSLWLVDIFLMCALGRILIASSRGS